MGCVGWKKQLTSSKLWAKNSKKLALQHPLQGQVTNGLTSARLPLFRALPPSGSVTCWLPWLQCVTLGGCRPTAIHSSAKGTTASLTSLLKSRLQAHSLPVSTNVWAWLGLCVAAVTANCSVDRGSMNPGSRNCCPNSECGSRLSHIPVSAPVKAFPWGLT